MEQCGLPIRVTRGADEQQPEELDALPYVEWAFKRVLSSGVGAGC